jgi:hypothetical protein
MKSQRIESQWIAGARNSGKILCGTQIPPPAAKRRIKMIIPPMLADVAASQPRAEIGAERRKCFPVVLLIV